MRKIIASLTILTCPIFAVGDPPKFPPPISPPNCEILCFNLDYSIRDLQGNHLDPSDEIVVGTEVRLFLELGSDLPLELYCCDNYWLEYIVNIVGQGIIINSEFEGLWGFANVDHNDNASAISVPIGSYIANSADIYDQCVVVFEAETTQLSTGNPNFFWDIGDLAGFKIVDPDVNHDGQVNVDDLVDIIISWGQNEAGDINCDGTTNIVDLLYVIVNWN